MTHKCSFIGGVVICEHINKLFSSFVRSTKFSRGQATQIRYFNSSDPPWAAEVAPDPMSWHISRMRMVVQTFTGFSHQMGNATSSLWFGQSQKPFSLARGSVCSPEESHCCLFEYQLEHDGCLSLLELRIPRSNDTCTDLKICTKVD